MPIEITDHPDLILHTAIEDQPPIDYSTMARGQVGIILDGRHSGRAVVKINDSFYQAIGMDIEYTAWPSSAKVRLLRSGDALTIVIK